jgi:hypothetical protein
MMDDRFPSRVKPWIAFEPDSSPHLQQARQAVAAEQGNVRRLRDKLGDKLHRRVDNQRRERELARTIHRELEGPPRTEGRPEQWQHDRHVRDVYAELKREVEERGGQVLCQRSERWLKEQVGKRCVQVRDQHGALTDEDRLRIASEFHLRVVDGKLCIPDFQLWIEKDGERYLGNVEVASANYHAKLIAKKRAAGFHVVQCDARGRKVRNGPEIVRSIIGR